MDLSKAYDVFCYFDLVRECGCFGDVISNEYQSVLQQAYYFNQVLEEQYRITKEDNSEFIRFYIQYRDWLMEQFMDNSFHFSKWRKSFSIKEKKTQAVQNFINIYQRASHSALFLAQTFQEYAYNVFDSPNQYRSYRFRYSSDRPVTAHKMYLASMLMLKILGYNEPSDEWCIENEKTIIDELNKKFENT